MVVLLPVIDLEEVKTVLAECMTPYETGMMSRVEIYRGIVYVVAHDEETKRPAGLPEATLLVLRRLLARRPRELPAELSAGQPAAGTSGSSGGVGSSGAGSAAAGGGGGSGLAGPEGQAEAEADAEQAELTLTRRTGGNPSDMHAALSTYWQLRLGGVLVGKALLSYENSELGRWGPALEIIEVVPALRRRGLGGLLLRVRARARARLGVEPCSAYPVHAALCASQQSMQGALVH
jgi:GNAT superfamily N-acetyltransferase